MGLRFSFVLAAANMSGGVKCNRLIAEALVARGHEVRILYPKLRPPRPAKGARAGLGRLLGKKPAPRPGKAVHHLNESTAELVPVDDHTVRAEHAPDADFVVASWWRVRRDLESWPESKGRAIHYLRHYELHGGDADEVHAVHRLPGPKIAVAKWLMRVMDERYGFGGTGYVPDAVLRSQFDAPPRGRAEAPTVGFLYSPTPWKGCATAAEAVRILRGRVPTLRTLMLGREFPPDGFGAPPNTEFHLLPDQCRMSSMYRRADVWLVPSTTEGFGMPGLEAAACRCPLVSTRCGGPEDYTREGANGRLIPHSDPAAMAEALEGVLGLGEAEWRAMSEASYEVSKEFDWDRSAERLERFAGGLS